MSQIRLRLTLLGFLSALLAVALQPALGARIEILTPSPGAELRGVIEFRATLTPTPGRDLTAPVLQTVNGRRLALSRDMGDIHRAALDTTKLPNGHQSLLVLATPKGTDERREGYADSAWGADRYFTSAEVPVVVRNPYHFYWGDIHAHTSYSDGAWFPEEAYAYARDEAKLDFFAITDHLEILTLYEYVDTIRHADRADAPGRFVAFYGVERTRGDTGHINFYMSPTHALPADLSDFYRAVGEMGLLAHFNHPAKEPPEDGGRHNDFQQFRYAPEADRSMAMVEVRDAEEEECYIAMLDNGWHVAPVGCEDKHDPTWGDGPTWTVALARELTREGILEALWARRTYSAADRDLQLELTVDGEDMGSQIARPVGSLPCSVTLNDPSGDIIERIDLFVDGKIVASAGPGVPEYAWTIPIHLSSGRHYCFIRVRQPEDRTTWSAPVWISAY